MLSRQAQVKIEELPKGWSIAAANFVNKVSNAYKIVFSC